MILMITRRDDLTADYLIERLLLRGVRYVRFDVDHYLDDVNLTAEFGRGSISGEIVTPQGTFPISAVRGVWYRRTMAPRLDRLDLSAGDRWFAERESRHFLEGALGAIPAKWVNPWWAVHVWERKLAQLPLAVACGFTVPHTLVTTEAAWLTSFAAERPVVAKAICQGFLEADGGIESIYTHEVPLKRLADQRAAKLCPTLVQQRLAKISDVRLTAIGRRQFAARLDADLPDGLDWRRPGTQVVYSPIDVPSHITESVRRMLRETSLVYGAFDFALMPNGDWIFLEVNPAGEFAWIEDKLDFPLRDVLIDELLSQEAS